MSKFVKDKSVLDIACGSGKGSYILAKEGGAKSVLASDINEQAVKYASIRYSGENISHKVADAEKFTSSEKYDVIVSFETIEHIQNIKAYLKSIEKVLSSNGSFFVSTPISSKELDEKPNNIYHLREWGFKSFHKVLEEYFEIEAIYVQLYPPMETLFDKIIRYLKAKIDHKANIRIMNIEDPFKWDNDNPHGELIGIKYNGYQIVQCKLK
jgi:ubiquinone/menaquinone biosynthesis C-methylase UbiE